MIETTKSGDGRRGLRLLAVVCACAGLGAGAAGQVEELPLPPPPPVDLPAVPRGSGEVVREIVVGDKFEIRNPKSETNSNDRMTELDLEVEGGNPGTGFAGIPSVPANMSSVPEGEIGEILNSIGGGAGTLEQKLYQQLRAALPDGGAGVILDQATLPADLKLPAGGWDARFEFRIPSRATGMIPFTGSLTGADGRLVRRFAGSVRLDREAQGVQVTRVVRRGEKIGEGDVQVMKARLGQLDRGAFDDAVFVAGTVARQELRPGRWVTEQMVEVPKVVKRGQGVTVRLQRGPIQITAPGICGEAGALGQVIKVQNAQSKREVFARVISGDEVQVIF